MDISEACAGVLYQHAEAEKGKLTGQIKITLTYQNGGITKAGCEIHSPLTPGARRPDFDPPGKNFG